MNLMDGIKTFSRENTQAKRPFFLEEKLLFTNPGLEVRK